MPLHLVRMVRATGKVWSSFLKALLTDQSLKRWRTRRSRESIVSFVILSLQLLSIAILTLLCFAPMFNCMSDSPPSQRLILGILYNASADVPGPSTRTALRRITRVLPDGSTITEEEPEEPSRKRLRTLVAGLPRKERLRLKNLEKAANSAGWIHRRRCQPRMGRFSCRHARKEAQGRRKAKSRRRIDAKSGSTRVPSVPKIGRAKRSRRINRLPVFGASCLSVSVCRPSLLWLCDEWRS